MAQASVAPSSIELRENRRGTVHAERVVRVQWPSLDVLEDDKILVRSPDQKFVQFAVSLPDQTADEGLAVSVVSQRRGVSNGDFMPHCSGEAILPLEHRQDADRIDGWQPCGFCSMVPGIDSSEHGVGGVPVPGCDQGIRSGASERGGQSTPTHERHSPDAPLKVGKLASSERIVVSSTCSAEHDLSTVVGVGNNHGLLPEPCLV
mmetsp:Transcript_19170/g.55713  ORF Transcript_19170/g.55713 Transcript_19170/m.55713 type:complete len:205 (-) Transcript_19170:951-1565(-)